ncbi:o-acyltransferase wsd1 [Quercus suber]|uniref:O-acyltransferase wsd1 n=1 Tax=Quercus suber TaxID=58331 RepID=A0AAW0IRB7_QUESU
MELKEGLEPASPNAQYFNSSVLSVSIIGVMQSEVPIETNEARTISLLNDVFLPINTRFSSIMVMLSTFLNIENNMILSSFSSFMKYINAWKVKWLKEGLQPASPNAQYFNSSVLSVSIIGVMQSEYQLKSTKRVKDRKGEKQWKRVEVKLEEHVNFPIFPTGLLPSSYDEYLEDYISNIAMEHFSQNKPLWEIHIVKYPTSNAAGTIIFKLHHALGDGYSLMGALLSCLQRADNPSLPLTFPSHQRAKLESGRESVWGRVSQLCSFSFNSVSDFGWSMLKSTLVEDDRTPIRSGAEGVEYQPIMVSNMIFSMDCIKHIKAKLGVRKNLNITIVSYMGNLRISAVMEKGLLDPQRFKSCVENAFEIILKAADDEIPI